MKNKVLISQYNNLEMSYKNSKMAPGPPRITPEMIKNLGKKVKKNTGNI